MINYFFWGDFGHSNKEKVCLFAASYKEGKFKYHTGPNLS